MNANFRNETLHILKGALSSADDLGEGKTQERIARPWIRSEKNIAGIQPQVPNPVTGKSTNVCAKRVHESL